MAGIDPALTEAVAGLQERGYNYGDMASRRTRITS
jgi:hypothetical protein